MKYYIQDTRDFIGNCIIFWGKNKSGYVTDINKAGLYSKKEAQSICNIRGTEIAWPKDYIKKRLQMTCDSQYIHENEAKILRRKHEKTNNRNQKRTGKKSKKE